MGERLRSISPVIATVIIVAVAIMLAIAVALWITGVIGGVSRMERLDITAAYVSGVVSVYNTTSSPIKYADYYNITIAIANKGSVATTIDMVFVNNKPLTVSTTASPPSNFSGINAPGNEIVICSKPTLNAGETTTITLYLKKGAYTPGQMIQIIVHTAAGGQYPAQVVLP